MATVLVNGDELALPDQASLTIDDSIVIYGYSRLTLDELEDIEGIHPGVLAALIHIAVQRAHPDIKASEIEATVRALNLNELIDSVTEDPAEDEEAGEGDLAPEPDRSSSGSEPISGSDSETSSEQPLDATGQNPSGTQGSDSVVSLRTRLAG